MTPIDRFERRLPTGLTELADPQVPGYLDDILATAARTRQRPRWTFIERWLPMPIAIRLAVVPRAVILLLLLALLLAASATVLTVGGRLHLLPAVAPLPAPTGLAANGLIAFESGGDIWVANPDGSGAHAIVTGPSLDSNPVWSPDGTRLLYWTREAAGKASSLVVVQADGGDPLVIAQDALGQVPWRTDWSPDGSLVAYSLCPPATNPDTCTELVYVVRTDGSSALQVGDPALAAARPDWSPDGKRLAFQGTPSGGTAGAYVMAADGTGVRRLDQLPDGDPAYNAFVVDWSPDGSGILTQAGSPSSIQVADAEGAGLRLLTDSATGDDGVAWWSPDGSLVAYMEGMNQAAVVTADGRVDRVLGVIPTSGSVTWSPDATALATYTAGGIDIVDVTIGKTTRHIASPAGPSTVQAQVPSWQRVAP